MTKFLDPIVDNWYQHLDKGQKFMIVAVDEEAELVELQYFDGALEEITMDDWYNLSIEICDEPENWSGPYDFGELDDLGTEITETSKDDWVEPLEEY